MAVAAVNDQATIRRNLKIGLGVNLVLMAGAYTLALMRVREGGNMKIEFVIGILFALCGSLSAQTTQPTSKSSQPAKELADKITSSDPAVRAAAVDEVRQQMVRPANIIGPLSQNYLPAFRKAGLNQDAADWAMQGILTAPMEPGMLESLYKQRIRSAAAGG